MHALNFCDKKRTTINSTQISARGKTFGPTCKKIGFPDSCSLDHNAPCVNKTVEAVNAKHDELTRASTRTLVKLTKSQFTVANSPGNMNRCKFNYGEGCDSMSKILNKKLHQIRSYFLTIFLSLP